MAEWPNASVSKTEVPKGSGGSNPSSSVSLYLAGKIHKGHEPLNEPHWCEESLKGLKELIPGVTLLNPALRGDDLADEKSVFGRDMTQVFCADVVLVDARERRGLGVGAEMMWAKANQIPVVTWAPEESHYRKKAAVILGVSVDEFIHPFIYGLSDGVAATLEEAAQMCIAAKEGKLDIKDLDWVRETMSYYRETQFEGDAAMQELAGLNERLRQRIDHLCR